MLHFKPGAKQASLPTLIKPNLSRLQATALDMARLLSVSDTLVVLTILLKQGHWQQMSFFTDELASRQAGSSLEAVAYIKPRVLRIQCRTGADYGESVAERRGGELFKLQFVGYQVVPTILISPQCSLLVS
jgi:hypothetical protein